LPNILEVDEEVKNPDTTFQEWMAGAEVGRMTNLAGVIEQNQGAYQEELRRISTRTSYGPSALDVSAVREPVVQVPSTPPHQVIEFPDTESGNTPAIPSTLPLKMQDEELPDTQPGDSFYPETEVPVSFYPQTEAGEYIYADTEPGESFHPGMEAGDMSHTNLEVF
jgi:hypothetical protein